MVKQSIGQKVVSFGEDMLGIQYFDRVKSATTLRQKMGDVFEGIGTLALTTTSFGGSGMVAEDLTKYVLERHGLSVETSLLRKMVSPPKTDLDSLLLETDTTFSGRTAVGKLTHDIFGQSFHNVLLKERGISQDIVKIEHEIQLQKQKFQEEENITFQTLENLGILVKKDSDLYEVPEKFQAMVKHAQTNPVSMPTLYGFGELNTKHYQAYQELMEVINDHTISQLSLQKEIKKAYVETVGKVDFDDFRNMYNKAFSDRPPLTFKLYKAIGNVARGIYASGGTFEKTGQAILFGDRLKIVQDGMPNIMNGEEYNELFGFVQV